MTATRRGGVDHPVSAGGVVFRMNEDEVEVVVCGRCVPEGWTWALPKGTPNPGETLEETAIREVTEETGLRVDIAAPIGSIQYWFGRSNDDTRYHKTVHFYLMSPVGGSIAEHDHEFDQVDWLGSGEAIQTLTYQNEVDILKKAVDMVSPGPKEEEDVD
jgi:8-oxo-dGTP pyrophosphatase MutT (NUDIX family)